MASRVTIRLDRTGPSNPTAKINNGDIYTASQLVTLALATGDEDSTGYSMKIWGDVDNTFDPNVQNTQIASQWQPFNAAPQVKLSSGDTAKNLHYIVRDMVNNPSNQVDASIILDTTLPVAMLDGPNVPVISEQEGCDTFILTLRGTEPFSEYDIRYGATSHETGTRIGTTNGSTNTHGTGNWTTSDVITVTIKCKDLVAISPLDGEKEIAAFIKDSAGKWSV